MSVFTCIIMKSLLKLYTFIKIETAYTLSKQTSWKGVDLLNISMNSLLKVIGIECVLYSDFDLRCVTLYDLDLLPKLMTFSFCHVKFVGISLEFTVL